MYPSCQKYRPFPIDAPEVITQDFKPLDADPFPYFGVVKLSIIPPKGLHHPVLPYRVKGKLFFPLCAKCAEFEKPHCDHSDEDRALVGAWCTPEVEKALEMGYRVLEVFEVWDYKEIAQYDGVDEKTGLFTSYVNMFLRLKQESDGYPKGVETEEEKMEYIENYFKREGVRLDPKKIEKNPGIRSLAKLMLNSFWGELHNGSHHALN
ncbi:MAG: hypothetical protein GY816_12040 [Cytophagales bacterium]|nr:hypothetical protein [Cytophagales bacterium]